MRSVFSQLPKLGTMHSVLEVCLGGFVPFAMFLHDGDEGMRASVTSSTDMKDL
jgi:hypothetical protein